MADDTSKMTAEQMAARIAELEGRLAKGGSISFKVSEKGLSRCMASVDSRLHSTSSNGKHCYPTFPSFASLSRPINRDSKPRIGLRDNHGGWDAGEAGSRRKQGFGD
jgi:hypothetical protein